MGSWVRIPSGARIFSEFPFDVKKTYHVLLLQEKAHFVVVASTIP